MKHLLKISYFIVFATIVASVSTSCGNESEPFMEDPNSLDINLLVPLTRSSPQEITDNFTYREVPVETNECMLNALLRIAVLNSKPVFGRRISPTYTAKQAYYAVRDSAVGYSQNKSKYENSYTNGAMTPSLGAEVGEKSGILTGKIRKFSNYDDLYRFLNDGEWAHDGKCIINFTHEGNSHSSICKGAKNNYTIKVHSTQYGTESMEPTKQYTNISIIY
ncbi:MAG: hypothetical protein IJ013_00915 [Bacteroidaceae bacterium]|nr:hypothetical protein [Bacteroidaceae bacterium]